jgi:hypothetical protein
MSMNEGTKPSLYCFDARYTDDITYAWYIEPHAKPAARICRSLARKEITPSSCGV